MVLMGGLLDMGTGGCGLRRMIPCDFCISCLYHWVDMTLALTCRVTLSMILGWW